jgi:hypothetical protein
MAHERFIIANPIQTRLIVLSRKATVNGLVLPADNAIWTTSVGHNLPVTDVSEE